MRLRTLTLVSLAVAAIATTALAGHHEGHGDHAMHRAQVGQQAPEFELVDQAGTVHKLSDYAGKTIVLEWTNPDCPYVQKHYELGTMAGLAADHSDVVWLAIDSSKHVTAKSASTWARQRDVSYPILLDSNGKAGRLYGAKTTPHMFVIAPDGKLVYDGAINSDDKPFDGIAAGTTNYVAKALAATLHGKAVETATTKPYGCSVKYAPEGGSAGAR